MHAFLLLRLALALVALEILWLGENPHLGCAEIWGTQCIGVGMKKKGFGVGWLPERRSLQFCRW